MNQLPRRVFLARSWSSSTEQSFIAQSIFATHALLYLSPKGCYASRSGALNYPKSIYYFVLPDISFCLQILQVQMWLLQKDQKFLCASEEGEVLFLMAITKPYIVCEPVCNGDSHSNTENCSQGLS